MAISRQRWIHNCVHGVRRARLAGRKEQEITNGHPEIDGLLAELCAERPSAAKRIVGKVLLQSQTATSHPSSESLRKAVEYRMAKLGISNGVKRRIPEARVAKRWTETETAALLGAFGADATIDSIALRTGHSVKAVRAKIARLDYQISEIHGVAVFTVAEVLELLDVTQRQIRRWKERGWLETKGRRITENMPRAVSPRSSRSDSVRRIAAGAPDIPARRRLSTARGAHAQEERPRTPGRHR